MYVEYCNYNKYIEDYSEELSNIFKVIEHGVNGICMPTHMIREVKEYMPQGIVISSPIDYPLGYCTNKVRQHMVIDALKSGANAIDYLPNQYLLRKKFKELIGEMATIVNICNDYGATPRVFIDTRYINEPLSICRKFHGAGIDICFPSVGYHHSDFFDTAITSALIQNKTKMSAIFNGYMWQMDQLELIMETELFGVRVYNTQLWCNYNL